MSCCYLLYLSTFSQSDDDGDDDLLTRVFFDEYEAQVLAAVSATKALVFQPYLMEDPNYPPSMEQISTNGVSRSS